MHVVVATLGTGGGVFPRTGLGVAPRGRRHRVWPPGKPIATVRSPLQRFEPLQFGAGQVIRLHLQMRELLGDPRSHPHSALRHPDTSNRGFESLAVLSNVVPELLEKRCMGHYEAFSIGAATVIDQVPDDPREVELVKIRASLFPSIQNLVTPWSAKM